MDCKDHEPCALERNEELNMDEQRNSQLETFFDAEETPQVDSTPDAEARTSQIDRDNCTAEDLNGFLASSRALENRSLNNSAEIDRTASDVGPKMLPDAELPDAIKETKSKSTESSEEEAFVEACESTPTAAKRPKTTEGLYVKYEMHDV